MGVGYCQMHKRFFDKSYAMHASDGTSIGYISIKISKAGGGSPHPAFDILKLAATASRR